LIEVVRFVHLTENSLIEMTEINTAKSRAQLALKILIPSALSLLGAVWLWLYCSAVQEALPKTAAPRQAFIGSVKGIRAFPKQGKNECGAFSLAFGIQLKTGVKIDPEAVVKRVSQQFSWSETLSGTLPWRLLREAELRGLSAINYTARSLSDGQRMEILKSHIARDAPVLILIENERAAQHYVLLVGYRDKELFFYDPNVEALESSPGLTRDLNALLPGNRSLTEAEFLAHWSQGGLFGLYRYWYFPMTL
jgi:hypothetical protein